MVAELAGDRLGAAELDRKVHEVADDDEVQEHLGDRERQLAALVRVRVRVRVRFRVKVRVRVRVRVS